jgi:hypothetical protein
MRFGLCWGYTRRRKQTAEEVLVQGRERQDWRRERGYLVPILSKRWVKKALAVYLLKNE